MIGYIYKITNLINNRVYVGSKLSPIFVENYWSSSKNDEYWIDIKKYGKENFKREILCWCETREEMREKEEALILSEGGLVRDGGYNQHYRAGTIIFTEQVREKMSKARRKNWEDKTPEERQAYSELRRKIALDPNGRMQSKEYKENMRRICTGRKNSKEHIEKVRLANIGRKKSDESRHKMSNARKGKPSKCHWWNNGSIHKFCEECPKGFVAGRLNAHWNNRRKKIYCVELERSFANYTEAAKYLNVANVGRHKKEIRECCEGMRESCATYHWRLI